MEEKLQSIPQQPSTHFSSRSHLLPMQNPLIESLSVCGVCVNPIGFLKRIDKRDLGYHGPLPRHHLVTLLLFCVGYDVETNEDQRLLGLLLLFVVIVWISSGSADGGDENRRSC